MMCQVHTGAYVSLLAPTKTDYTACHPRKTTTYILHVVVPITMHTHVRHRSIGKKKQRKGKKRKERKGKKRRESAKGKEKKEKARKARKDKTRRGSSGIVSQRYFVVPQVKIGRQPQRKEIYIYIGQKRPTPVETRLPPHLA